MLGLISARSANGSGGGSSLARRSAIPLPLLRVSSARSTGGGGGGSSLARRSAIPSPVLGEIVECSTGGGGSGSSLARRSAIPLPFLGMLSKRSTGGGAGFSADPLPCILAILSAMLPELCVRAIDVRFGACVASAFSSCFFAFSRSFIRLSRSLTLSRSLPSSATVWTSASCTAAPLCGAFGSSDFAVSSAMGAAAVSVSSLSACDRSPAMPADMAGLAAAAGRGANPAPTSREPNKNR